MSNKITVFLRSIFGKVSWQRPTWQVSLSNYVRTRPKVVGTIITLMFLILLFAVYGYRQYQQMPKPQVVTAKINVPAITSVSDLTKEDQEGQDQGHNQGEHALLPINPLTIEFSESVASLQLFDKEIIKGITISPQIKGQWRWDREERLTFVAQENWPAGKKFVVTCDQEIFRPNAKFAARSHQFITPPLRINVKEFKFYYNPIDPKNHEAIATIEFNYPIDTTSFENSITLSRQLKEEHDRVAKNNYESTQEKIRRSFNIDSGSNDKMRFTVTYDKYKRTAFLHSEPLPITQDEYYLKLNIAKNVAPSTGNATVVPTEKFLLIPAASTIFKISDVSAVVVRNIDDRSEQVLNIETTECITAAELNQKLHVYLLPPKLLSNNNVNRSWRTPGEVTNEVLKNATTVELEPIPTEREDATLHSYKIKNLDLKKFTANNDQNNNSKTNQKKDRVSTNTEDDAIESAQKDENDSAIDDEDGNGDATNNNEQKYQLYVTIDSGVRSHAGFILAEQYRNIISLPANPQEISFLHQGAILTPNNERKISVLTRGIPAIRIEVAKILPHTVNFLVSQTRGSAFNNPQFINSYNFNQTDISEIFAEVAPINNTDLGKNQYFALDLAKYLTVNKQVIAAKNNQSTAIKNKLQAVGAGPHGLFLLQLQGWDMATKRALNVVNQRLILITDLGLIVKNNVDKTHDFFVTSITNGGPVAGAAITLLGRNGLPLVKRTTDTEGHTNFPNLENFVEEQEPTVYLAQLGDDISFIPYQSFDRLLNYTRYDVGGVSGVAQNKYNLKVFLFTERGIYRPGDTVHIAGIVKRNYLDSAPTKLPLEIVVIDPNSQTVKKQLVAIDQFGYFTLDHETQLASPTGQYNIALYLAKSHDGGSDEVTHHKQLLAETDVSIHEFLPDRLRLDAKFISIKDSAIPSIVATHGWIAPAALQAKITLQNLYGAPAVARRIASKIFVAPMDIHFDQYQEYVFTNPFAGTNSKKEPKVHTETMQEVQTNNNGQAELKLDAILSRFDKTIYNLTLFIEAFEKDGGRSVATKLTTLVNPLPYLVGYNPLGDLSFIKHRSKRNVNLIALDANLKIVALPQLTLQVFAKQQIATLTKKLDGSYQYQTVEQLSPASSVPFALIARDNNYQLDTSKIGNFRVVIRDSFGNEVCKFDYSVVGESQNSIQQNAELGIKLNKDEYLENEEIEIEITAPYTGSGLITIERDRVYAAQWFRSTTTSSLQKIRIPQNFKGNAYINVTFVRDWNSPEIFINPLSYSIVPIKVVPATNSLNVSLQVPPTVLAGKVIPITYSSDKPGKVIIFAVDEGILRVTKYATPNPLQYFFAKTALEVETMQILDQILPKYVMRRELSAVGGDAGKMDVDKSLNPFRRKVDAPIVYWSKILDINNQPQQVSYLVPDYFNGTLRIMAVAVADQAVGAATTTIKVGNYFVINANTPTFVAPGDEFEVTAVVGNNLKQIANDNSPHATIKIKLATSAGLEVVNAQEQEQIITVEPSREKAVHFKLRAKDILGNANLIFTAQSGGKSSSSTTTLSVRPAAPYITTLTSGYTVENAVTLSVDRVLHNEYRNVTAALSTSPLILLSGMQTYLEKFPYFCTEQITSKMFITLALIKDPSVNTDKRQQLNDQLQDLMQLQRQRQNSSGGFDYWPGMAASSLSSDNHESVTAKFTSLYAIHFLTEAKIAGIAVPDDVLERGLSYLRELNSTTTVQPGQQQVANLEQLRLTAYAIYLLTRNEIVTTNYLTQLQLILEKNYTREIWGQDIIAVYLAATYKLLQNEKEALKLIDYFAFANDKNHDRKVSATSDLYFSYNSFNNPNTFRAQYLALIAQHFPERLARYNRDLTTAIATKLSSQEISTVLAGYSSLALMSAGTGIGVEQNQEKSLIKQKNHKTLPALVITELPQRIKLNATSEVDTINGMTNGIDQSSTYQKVLVSNAAQKITFSSDHNYEHGFFYQLVQAGFDKKLIAQQDLTNGVEIWREYRDLNGKVTTSAQLGQEVTVHIRVRLKADKNKDEVLADAYHYIHGLSVAVVDLLPGGFEVVRESIMENGRYTDVREDRVLFFTYINDQQSDEIVYRIKAINKGNYAIPPAFVEAMYDNTKKALGKSGMFMITSAGDRF